MLEKETKPTLEELFREAFPRRRRLFETYEDELYDDDDADCCQVDD